MPGARARETWIEISLVDEAGWPAVGARYRLELADGSVREGRLGPDGTARLDGVAPGEGKLDFPDLDRDAWTRA